MNENYSDQLGDVEVVNYIDQTIFDQERLKIGRRELFISISLLVTTFLTTLLAGFSLDFRFKHPNLSDQLDLFPGLSTLPVTPLHIFYGLPFSLALLTILLAHELGHYLTCRYYGIRSTLPYFIPFPSIIGTMGAFIRIKSPFHNRRALFDVGVAGPIAGFIFIIPALIVGMLGSKLIPWESTSGLYFGEPLIFKLAAYLFLPISNARDVINLHPIGWAAWFGTLATCLNLLPVGQLDGGHIVYALFGPRTHKIISLAVVISMVSLSVFAWRVLSLRTPSYLFFGIILLLLGLRHPKTLNNDEAVGNSRFYIGAFALLIFILCFIAIPVAIY